MSGREGTAGRTFRDPAGSTEVLADRVHRRVYWSYAGEMLRFLNDPLAEALVAEGRLIATAMLETEEEGLLLHHPRVPFISYPWEWPATLWISAAELTLGLAMDLVRAGWTLKDATPLNVLFRGSNPVFVDVLSIERSDPSEAIWLAYGQFVRTFLLPLLASMCLGWPLGMLSMRREGYEPEEVYRCLPWHWRVREPALSAATLPVLFSKRSGTVKTLKRYSGDPEVNRSVLLRTLGGLLRQVRRVAPPVGESAWAHYPETARHYSETDGRAKRAFVLGVLRSTGAERVLDVGCNAGVYSRLAAEEAGASVVAIDSDGETVERLAAALKGTGLDILPLCVDLAQPTPSTGWENGEFDSFLSRCAGHFDLAMMLAVLHHLLVSSRIPLDRIASLCAGLTTKSLVVEWVPAEDVKFQEIVRGRGTLYGHLTEAAFRCAFGVHFHVADELRLENGRTLFHLVKGGA